MKSNWITVWLVLLALVCSGCSTLSDAEIRQLQRSILDTHRRVARLEETTNKSLEEMRAESRRTRALVEESLNNAQEEMRRTGGQVDENTHHVRQLTAKLDDIVYSLRGGQAAAVKPPVEKPTARTPVVRPDETAEKPPADTEKPETPSPLLAPVSPEEDYRRAKVDYDKGNLELAKLEFETYLQLYPDSELAPNAQFWLAECYFKSGDFRRAVTEFQKVYTEFPQNNKMADAMLNEAYAHDRLGQREEAVRLLRRIISEYGDSGVPAVQSARIKLEALGESVD